jgi:hypothetical protein
MEAHNTVKITLKNPESATKALEILRNRLSKGFEIDKIYRRNPSQRMREALEVNENTIVLPEDFGCYITEDAEDVMFELIQHLAENMGKSSFTWDGWDSNNYTDGHFEAEYENGFLKIKYTYYPSGDCRLCCPECGEMSITPDEYEEGKTYICSECGEEIDVSEWVSVITEKTIQIL